MTFTESQNYRIGKFPPSFGQINQSLKNPMAFWTPDMRSYDLAFSEFLGHKAAIAFSPELVGIILQDKKDHFKRSHIANRMLAPALGEGLLTIDGEKWKSHRKIVARAFRYEALLELLPRIQDASDKMVYRLSQKDGDDFDIAPEITRTTFDIIQELLFDADMLQDEHEYIFSKISSYLETLGRLDFFDVLPVVHHIARLRYFRGYMAARQFRKQVRQTLEKMNEQPDAIRQTSLASLLIEAKNLPEAIGFEDSHVVDNILTFLGAGHETTAVSLSWTIHLLKDRPQLWSELQSEARAVPDAQRGTMGGIEALPLHLRVIKEALRMFPPVPQIGRTVIRPTTIGGEPFKPGDHITVAIGAIHMDPNLWTEPNVFNPDRFLPEQEKDMHRFQYLPFGGGRHICIGMNLSLWEAQIILAAITGAFDIAPPLVPKPTKPTVNVTMRPDVGVHVRLKPIAPAPG